MKLMAMILLLAASVVTFERLLPKHRAVAPACADDDGDGDGDDDGDDAGGEHA